MILLIGVKTKEDMNKQLETRSKNATANMYCRSKVEFSPGSFRFSNNKFISVRNRFTSFQLWAARMFGQASPMVIITSNPGKYDTEVV